MIENLALAAALWLAPADRDREWMRPSRSARSADISLLQCVIRHESLHAGGPHAENPRSTASGLFQFLDSTWRGVARWVDGASRYRHASDAPADIQWAVALHVVEHGGASAWHGTGCPRT